MAGDWIKMRVGLTNHPRVLSIADTLLNDGAFMEWSGLSYAMAGYPAPSKEEDRAERHAALRVIRYVTVTALLKFWGYANEHAKGDFIQGIGPEDADEITGVPTFGIAMEAAGWALFDRENGGMKMPNFEEHNTCATARTSAGAERQKRYRERHKQAPGVTPKSDVTRDVTVTEREEKRREEISKGDPDLFESFYAAYPRKVGKDAARKAFAKRDVDAALLVVMVAAIKAQGLKEKCAKGESQFVPHPATWLNEGRWQDEVAANDDDPFGLRNAI